MASARFHAERDAQAAEKRRLAARTKKYRVTGNQAVAEVAPGGVVTLTVAHGERLLASGHVEEITVQRGQSADETGHDGPKNKE